MVERAYEPPANQIPPELHLAVAEVIEQIEELGHWVTLVHAEPYNRDHYVVNLDTTADHHGSAEGEQQAMKQITQNTVEHADEVAVAVQEGPSITGDGVFFELEVMIRITEQGG